jgi:hypothetical protein
MISAVKARHGGQFFGRDQAGDAVAVLRQI